MASDSGKTTKETSEMSDSEYARVGIALWLNNKPLEAEDHFKKRKNKLQVEAGYTFISFLVIITIFDKFLLDFVIIIIVRMSVVCVWCFFWI